MFTESVSVDFVSGRTELVGIDFLDVRGVPPGRASDPVRAGTGPERPHARPDAGRPPAVRVAGRP
jgi:hypothetical protein